MRGTLTIVLGFLSVLGVGLAQAQDCPCWTAEELATVQPILCRNDLDLDDASSLTCTSINSTVENCSSGPAGPDAWVMAWNGDVAGDAFGWPGCYWQQPVPGPFRSFCPGAQCDGPITPEQVLSCAHEIAALGESFVSGTCRGDGNPCDSADDCTRLCSVGDTPCDDEEDCPPAGVCPGGGYLRRGRRL